MVQYSSLAHFYIFVFSFIYLIENFVKLEEKFRLQFNLNKIYILILINQSGIY